MDLQTHLEIAKFYTIKGGPSADEYSHFNDWVRCVYNDVLAERLLTVDLAAIRNEFGDVLTPTTLIGYAYTKPRSYPGDFEIIDRMYRCHVSTDVRFVKWDDHYHTQDAAIAVRNRKEYFKRLLKEIGLNRTEPRVLDVASGPARDLAEYFAEAGGHELQVDCLEYDTGAIAFASALCSDHLESIRFQQGNALRFRSKENYDLIWSAGLFDYFDDDRFRFLLKRLWNNVTHGGEIVIGNFSDSNPTRGYMEVLGDWKLHHRSPHQLQRLAIGCGIESTAVRVDSEETGVNLFLHIKKT